MEQSDLQRYRSRLSEMRDRSRNEINRMIQVVLNDAEAPGEHDHRVSEAIDKEIALEKTEEEIRNAVIAALQRIDDNTFGQCERCGAKIPKARLDAIPFTPYCVKCASRHEG
jgi:DnaK suppressor protein